MRVCHIVPSLEERHGGPSRSVRALANAMARLGTPTDLATTHDPASPALASGDDAATLHVCRREPPRSLCRSRELRTLLEQTPFDLVQHHSLWLLPLHYAHSAARRRGAPLVIAPRGMMSDWAWAHHRARKRVAEWLVHPGAFAAAAGWHATSQGEADEIRRRGFRQPVCVAPNGVTLPQPSELTAARDHWMEALPVLRGRRVALFYSRFHRKKRLRELIDVWSRHRSGDWFLLVAGVPEEFSVAEVQGWIDAAGLADHAAVVDGRGRPSPYGVADLFLLPTHSENFGLVIAEALAAGVPAVVTDGTPWQGLEENGAGWCVAWSDYTAALNAALVADPTELRRRGEIGRAWMAADFTWESSARRLLEFYTTLRHG